MPHILFIQDVKYEEKELNKMQTLVNENEFENLRNRVDTYKYSPLIFFSLFTSPKLDIGLYGTKRLNRLCSLHLRAKVTKRHYIFFLCDCKVRTRHDKPQFKEWNLAKYLFFSLSFRRRRNRQLSFLKESVI